MRSVGRIMFWAAGSLLVVSVAAGIIMAVLGFGRVADSVTDTTPVSGPTQVTLAEGDRLLYYVPGVADGTDDSSGSPSYAPAADANCSVTGPDARDLSTTLTSTSTTNGETRVSDGGFEARAAGDYTITCAPSPDVEVVLAPPIDAGGVFGGVGGVLLAVFGTLGFGVAAVVGVILWIVGRNTMKKHGAP